MSCHTGGCNQHTEAVPAGIGGKSRRLIRRPVCRENVHFVRDMQSFQRIRRLADHRKVTVTAHDDSDFFHTAFPPHIPVPERAPFRYIQKERTNPPYRKSVCPDGRHTPRPTGRAYIGGFPPYIPCSPVVHPHSPSVARHGIQLHGLSVRARTDLPVNNPIIPYGGGFVKGEGWLKKLKFSGFLPAGY